MTATAIPTQHTVTRERHRAVVDELHAEIDQLRARLTAAEHRATHDKLTGLLNRAGLEERWANGWMGPTLALIDLNGFKEVNDTYGHACGDEVLRQVGIRIAEFAGAGQAARLGGDEFVVEVGGSEGARELARWIGLPVLIGPGPLEVCPTAAIGVASAGRDLVRDLANTIERADVALYAAKESGSPVASTVVVYDPAVHGVPERQDRPVRRRRDAQTPPTRADVWQAQLPDYGDLPGGVCSDAGQAARDRIELEYAPVIRMGGAA